MRFLGRYRRGQVRGIDFSLAMIIFLLTMAQVLSLTGTFIDNAQNSQGLSSDLSTTQLYANEIINTPGYSTFANSISWNDVTTLNLNTNGWNFGLGNGNGSIDPFKLGRVSNVSHPDYQLTYDQIKSATSLDRDFELRVRSTIDVKIETITRNGAAFDITGIVTSFGSPLTSSTVNLFVNDGTSTTSTYVTTNTQGIFAGTVSTSVSDATSDMIVAIASYGRGNYDMDYAYSTEGTPQEFGMTLTEEDTSSGYGVIAEVDNSITTPTYHAFYTGNAVQNFTQSSTNDIQVPQDGFVVVMARDGDSFAITNFPIIIDNYLTQPIISSDPFGTETTAYELLINIRNVLLRFSFITWS